MANQPMDWIQGINAQIKRVTPEQLAMAEPKNGVCSRCVVVGELPPRLQALSFIISQHHKRAAELEQDLLKGEKIDIAIVAEIDEHRSIAELLGNILGRSIASIFPETKEHRRIILKAGWKVVYHKELEAHDLLFSILAGAASDFLHRMNKGGRFRQ
jgi:hypothetical protein